MRPALDDTWLWTFARRHGLSSAACAELAEVLSDTSSFPSPGLAAVTLAPATTLGVDGTLVPATVDRDAGTLPPVDGEPLPIAERYVDLGQIAVGGMGEVRRVHDRVVRRTLVMKIVRADLASRPDVLAQFALEARITARLGHPGIVPVHDLGTLPDGRPYFTMKEAIGSTLSAVIRESHARPPVPLRRLVDVFHTICQAVAFAHAADVVHRDLKPSNVMVCAWGEVLVMDWGLARSVGPGRGDLSQPGERAGTVSGTPSYMAPEQALGVPGLSTRADVYALGAILYQILVGEPPFRGTTEDVLAALRRGEVPAWPEEADRPAELVAVARKAMAGRPEHRFADAGELGAEIAAWLEGARRRDEGLLLVRRAEAARPALVPLREDARALRAEAARMPMPERPALEDLERRWMLEDRAQELEDEAELEALRIRQLLHGAVAHAPDLSEAHALLADLYREQHRDAERAHQEAEARRLEVLVRAHGAARHAAYLEGKGALSLVSEPPARAVLFRIARRHRRRIALLAGELGLTPLFEVELPAGAWLVELSAPGRATVRVPVVVARCGRWTSPVVVLPPADAVGEGDVVVPAGPARLGGDPLAAGAGPERVVGVDAFVIRRDPVTWRELLPFLVATGGAPPGRLWRADWPAVGVDQATAERFAAWEAERTGLPWRLPTSAEWEKAARGTDGRLFPWGDEPVPQMARIRLPHGTAGSPAPIDRHPADTSPYGVRGLGGNVRDRCADGGVRGGSWSRPIDAARAAARETLAREEVADDVGFRLARDLGDIE